jgi:hypothetical protein
MAYELDLRPVNVLKTLGLLVLVNLLFASAYLLTAATPQTYTAQLTTVTTATLAGPFIAIFLVAVAVVAFDIPVRS